MSEKVQAIVIKANDRKEKDKNILLFSLEKGKIWATLKGVKSPNAKMKLAQNPFCYGEFVLEESKTGLIVTNFNCLEAFHELTEDLEKYFEATAVLEVLAAQEQESQDVKLFVLALKTLKSICFGNAKPTYALDKFLIELFSQSGSPIYSETCTCCGSGAVERFFIDYSDGKLVCVGCKGYTSEELSKTTYAALKFLNNTDFEKLPTLKLAEGSEIALLKVLVKNFDYRFDHKLKFMGILS